jgi:hypothetical protein
MESLFMVKATLAAACLLLAACASEKQVEDRRQQDLQNATDKYATVCYDGLEYIKGSNFPLVEKHNLKGLPVPCGTKKGATEAAPKV